MTTTIAKSHIQDQTIEAAVKYLEHKGYDNIERAENKPYDLVARDVDNTLVFIVVQMRTANAEGFAELPSGNWIPRLERAAAEYLVDHETDTYEEVRFDNISLLVMTNNRALLRHYHNFINDLVA